jgi:hypothetical protein
MPPRSHQYVVYGLRFVRLATSLLCYCVQFCIAANVDRRSDQLQFQTCPSELHITSSESIKSAAPDESEAHTLSDGSRLMDMDRGGEPVKYTEVNRATD